MVPPSASKSLKRKRAPEYSQSALKRSKARLSKRPTPNDDDLASDASQEESAGFGLDGIDLRAPQTERETDEEDETETPADKRLRLAKLYLETVRNELGTVLPSNYTSWAERVAAQNDGAYNADAADADRELITARLQKDAVRMAYPVSVFKAHCFHSSSTRESYTTV